MKGTCTADMLKNGICMQDGEYCREGGCQLDFFEENDRNCGNCKHLDNVDGGSPEYASPIYVCIEFPGYGNLLSFPFKKEMSCFDS